MSRITDVPGDVAEAPRVVHPATQLGPALRVAAAATLVLGTGLQAASWLVDAEPTYRATLAAAAAGATRVQISELLGALAIPFLVGGFAVYILLGRRRSPRMAWAGGVLAAAGVVELGVHLGGEMFQVQLAATRTLTPAAIARLADSEGLPATVVETVFLGGVAIGLTLTVVSLWRSGAVPRPAAALLGAFFVIDLTGRGVESHLVALVAAGWIAACVLRGAAFPTLFPSRTARTARG